MPTAGASLARARRTLASASGPGAWSCGCAWAEPWSCSWAVTSVPRERGGAALGEGAAALGEVLARPGAGEGGLVAGHLGGVVVVGVEADLGARLAQRCQRGRLGGQRPCRVEVAALLG